MLTTTVTLSGTVIFEGNTAFQGGAIHMTYSMLRLKSDNKTNTNISFINNMATNAGGGIFVDHSPRTDLQSGSSCFYEEIQGVSFNELSDLIVNVTLHFTNNSAIIGGMDIFGATPNSQCEIFLDDFHKYFCNDVFEYVFKTSSNLSSISSDPKRVCLCESSSHTQLLCGNFSHIFYDTAHYPGELFPLFLAVVGFEFGTVTGPIYANLLPNTNNSMSSLGNGQRVRKIEHNGCTNLNFSINTLNNKEIIVLTTSTTKVTEQESIRYIDHAVNGYHYNPRNMIPVKLLTVPVYIQVALLDCPPGFQFVLDLKKCDCASELRKIGINDCLIYNSIPYITRSKNQWIKSAHSEGGGLLYSKYCPFNYCKQNVISLNLNDPDRQCALNHTGILCGACPANFSLMLGSSKCFECKNNYHILLLIAFVLAGIILVLFLKVVDITVAAGTINGLIFYANIIWANQSILFPPQSETISLLIFLKVFIAWLNLDLGIETCFIQYLNGYWKTWLQFVFPGYIWLITCLIIFLSHYSTTATKIFGNNSVPVLVTLFLLSYAKLLRTILVILEFTILEHPDGPKTIWSFDGNIPYFGMKHGILFVVALTIILVLWLPYTFGLLFIQCLRRHSHYRLLKWVNKFKPLFDSYLGPLRVKHHYWIGLGLLARLTLLLISAATLTTVSFLAAMINVLMASAPCVAVFRVYKKWQLQLLEACFLFNLALFNCDALYVEAQGGSKDSLASISLGITFILFSIITGYHIWKRLKTHFLCRRKHSILKTNDYEEHNIIMQSFADDQQPHQGVTYQVVSVHENRESLLNNTS